MAKSKVKGYNHRRVLEHRYIIEKYLGRLLTDDEVVHHINGDKKDNRIENLQVMTQSEHMKLHQQQRTEAKRKELEELERLKPKPEPEKEVTVNIEITLLESELKDFIKVLDSSYSKYSTPSKWIKSRIDWEVEVYRRDQAVLKWKEEKRLIEERRRLKREAKKLKEV